MVRMASYVIPTQRIVFSAKKGHTYLTLMFFVTQTMRNAWCRICDAANPMAGSQGWELEYDPSSLTDAVQGYLRYLRLNALLRGPVQRWSATKQSLHVAKSEVATREPQSEPRADTCRIMMGLRKKMQENKFVDLEDNPGILREKRTTAGPSQDHLRMDVSHCPRVMQVATPSYCMLTSSTLVGSCSPWNPSTK